MEMISPFKIHPMYIIVTTRMHIKKKEQWQARKGKNWQLKVDLYYFNKKKTASFPNHWAEETNYLVIINVFSNDSFPFNMRVKYFASILLGELFFCSRFLIVIVLYVQSNWLITISA